MTAPTPRPFPTVERRHLLRGSMAVAAAGALGSGSAPGFAAATTDLPRWSDPSTWGGSVPGVDQVAVVDGPVLLDQDAEVGGLELTPEGRLVFDPQASRTLRTTGNVVVGGLLEMRPADPDVEHLIRFEDIDESTYVGGGMEVLDSDVGLWLTGPGQLDLQGAPRAAWVRAAGSLCAADTTIRLAAPPVGWRVGDELVVTPTGAPVDSRHMERFDEVTVAAIADDLVTLDRPLRYAHPAVSVGDGHVLAAEVLNLTRNVRVEGTATGRTHTMATMVTRPSQVRYASFRHFGPRQPDGKYSRFVTGRYGFHWHMCGDGTRGSLMEGVVMRDGGNHAFVTHLSNGVTHRSCISYDTIETPYWWDGPEDTRSAAPPTDDAVYDGCVAALVRSDPEFRGYRLAGFGLGAGEGNVARGCIAVGVLGSTDAAGFNWPEGSGGTWDFRDCVTHNNARHGIFTWQNGPLAHVVGQFIAYHNGGFGVAHGAYRNRYHYRDAILFGNREGGLLIHAVSKEGRKLRFSHLLIDAAGQAPYGIEVRGHKQPPLAPTLVVGCRLLGYTQHGIALTGDRPSGQPTRRDRMDVVDCEFSGNEFWLGDDILRSSRIRYARPSGTLELRPRAVAGGRLRRPWNARVERVADLATGSAPRRISVRVSRRAPG